ncbi:GntR family transcriptional regulator [Tamaricihabitans halophyticus]|uniref:GntR family transcriptional regulator n=1 Tax=Tamaricihabitans halophyticus TaxID=1262583 RepID=A0A4R2QUU0_9PSEU|nr:GntR family transcriptional regulator [Tamaricihabitans halophyticus]TCP53024.1 GntR family transcriptional regulator [Tamaricihabitans halophyticus]
MNVPASESTSRQPARVRVIDWVRDGVLRGELRPGAFLDEAVVCEAVGVSRTPVREAFHQLAAEKFLHLTPRRGAQVSTVTARDLVEVYEMRKLLEGYAVQTLVQRGIAPPPEVDELLAMMHEPARVRRYAALEPEELFASSELNVRFHRAIVAATGNSVLTELYDNLRSRQQRVSVSAVQAQPDRLTTINREHTALVQALRDGDAEGATTILHRHLQPVETVLSKLPPA